MSTRCFISKKTKDGYVGIYSHWDGYPEEPGVGYQLKNYYKSPQKVDSLIALGDISSLRKNIGRKHNFDNYDLAKEKEYTTAYHRDRGEPWDDVKPQFFKTKEEMERYFEDSWCEYLYIYEKGSWHCYGGDGYEIHIP